MSCRISGIVLTLLWLHSPIVFGQAHFKRFPETMTNNGAYVLGWGIKDDPAGSVDSKTEIVADGPEKIDIGEQRFETSEGIEDYLVDTATGKIVATIPDFTYYAGSEGRHWPCFGCHWCSMPVPSNRKRCSERRRYWQRERTLHWPCFGSRWCC